MYTTIEADPDGAASFLRKILQEDVEYEEPEINTNDWFRLENEVEEKLNRNSLWDNPSPIGKGLDYELLRGANISIDTPNHPVVDDIYAYDKIATSLKTMNLHDRTYQYAENIFSTGSSYVDDFFSDKFEHGINTREGYQLTRDQIQGFNLEIGIPFGATEEQKQQIYKLQEYGRAKGVRVIIAEVK